MKWKITTLIVLSLYFFAENLNGQTETETITVSIGQNCMNASGEYIASDYLTLRDFMANVHIDYGPTLPIIAQICQGQYYESLRIDSLRDNISFVPHPNNVNKVEFIGSRNALDLGSARTSGWEESVDGEIINYQDCDGNQQQYTIPPPSVNRKYWKMTISDDLNNNTTNNGGFPSATWIARKKVVMWAKEANNTYRQLYFYEDIEECKAHEVHLGFNRLEAGAPTNCGSNYSFRQQGYYVERNSNSFTIYLAFDPQFSKAYLDSNIYFGHHATLITITSAHPTKPVENISFDGGPGKDFVFRRGLDAIKVTGYAKNITLKNIAFEDFVRGIYIEIKNNYLKEDILIANCDFNHNLRRDNENAATNNRLIFLEIIKRQPMESWAIFAANDGLTPNTTPDPSFINLRIENNNIDGVGGGIQVADGEAYISGNRLTNIIDDGIEVDGVARNMHIYDNIIVNCDGAIFSAVASEVGPVYFYNNVSFQKPEESPYLNLCNYPANPHYPFRMKKGETLKFGSVVTDSPKRISQNVHFYFNTFVGKQAITKHSTIPTAFTFNSNFYNNIFYTQDVNQPILDGTGYKCAGITFRGKLLFTEHNANKPIIHYFGAQLNSNIGTPLDLEMTNLHQYLQSIDCDSEKDSWYGTIDNLNEMIEMASSEEWCHNTYQEIGFSGGSYSDLANNSLSANLTKQDFSLNQMSDPIWWNFPLPDYFSNSANFSNRKVPGAINKLNAVLDHGTMGCEIVDIGEPTDGEIGFGPTMGKLISRRLSISPNPTSDQIKVSNFGESVQKIEIFNMSGNQIHSLSLGELNEVSVDVSKWLPGIYFLSFINASGDKETERFVKF